MIDSSLISSLGFPIAVVCYLFWERHCQVRDVRKERMETMMHLEKAIKNDLVHAIDDLKMEIIKLNERLKSNEGCNVGCKKKD